MNSYAQPGQPAPAQPSRAWTAVGIAVLALALVLTGFFTWKAIEHRPATPQPVKFGPVNLDREGLTIYSSVPMPRAPCQAQDSTGADVSLQPPNGSESISLNSTRWYVVARSATPVPAGEYSINCTDEETGAAYFAGPRVSVAGFAGAVFAALGSLGILGVIGVVLIVVGAVKRHRANRPPSTTFPGSNYPPPGSGPPGYGQTFPSQTFPSQTFPSQTFPSQTFPSQGNSNQGNSNQGNPYPGQQESGPRRH